MATQCGVEYNSNVPEYVRTTRWPVTIDCSNSGPPAQVPVPLYPKAHDGSEGTSIPFFVK